MKQIIFLLIILPLLFTSCVPANTTKNRPTAELVDLANPTAITIESTLTPTSSPTSQPTIIPTFTGTPDITALRTQGINEPWIIATLGTKIPPGWYQQRVMFSPNGKFLISSYGNKISLWQVGSYKKLNEFVVLNEHYGVERFAFSSDDRLLTTTLTYYDDPKSHLFVWDTASMELKFSMELDMAILEKDLDYPYHYPATAIAFVPNSTRLVTANGNSIQIINVEDTTELVTIDLGQDMYASDISFPNDGRFIYVFMEWWKDNGFRLYPRYQTKYVVQIWDTKEHFLWRTLNFPDINWAEEFKGLHGSYLVTRNPAKGTLEMMSLENEEIEQLPYRQGQARFDGWEYITNDNRYILFSRYFGTYDKQEQGIEFWTTDSWRMLYKFQPDFYNDPDFLSGLGSDPGEIAISNDNNWLAIAYAGQVFIYDIRILTTP
jgi:hypothetical protein